MSTRERLKNAVRLWRKRKVREIVLIVALVAMEAAVFQARPMLHPEIYGPRLPPVIRIAAPPLERIFSTLSPYGPGLECELVERFCKKNGVQAKWIRTETLQEGFEALVQNRADIFIGAGFWPKGIPDDLPLLMGPVYEKHLPLMLHHVRRHPLQSPFEICDVDVYVQNNSRLEELYSEFTSAIECPNTPRSSESVMLGEPLAELDADSSVRFSVVEPGSFLPWRPFFTNLRPTSRLHEYLPYRWYWRTDVPLLSQRLEIFWRKLLTGGDYAAIRDRYFGFFPDKPDYYDLFTLKRTIRQRLPRYQRIISKTAERYDIPSLLLVALIQHESRFNANAVSRTGVRGIMQLTLDTAALWGVSDRTDPAQAIPAGARQLRHLRQSLDGKVDPVDLWSFVLAAYNQGLGHVYDAMDLAERLGHNRRRWKDVKDVFPLLARRKYYTHSKHGYTRGWEAVDYVESVRYYRYVLRGLLVLARPGLSGVAGLRAELEELPAP